MVPWLVSIEPALALDWGSSTCRVNFIQCFKMLYRKNRSKESNIADNDCIFVQNMEKNYNTLLL